MLCLERVVAGCAGGRRADVNDGGPALQPVVTGAMEQVRGANGCCRAGGFDPGKQRMVVHDRVGQKDFIVAAAAEIQLTADEVAELEAAVPPEEIAGDRYAAASMKTIDR